MTELTLAIVDDSDGRLIVDTERDDLARAIVDDLADDLGMPAPLGCALPLAMSTPGPTPGVSPEIGARVSGWWHDSLVEGPGRRSVVRFQGCPIRCVGCWVPETHDPNAGHVMPIDGLADELLDPEHDRDGVTILGGEPFAQPAALHSLLGELRGRQPNLHVLVYTGFTLEALRHRADPDVHGALDLIDVLIDGPFVRALSDGAGPWVGSTNQRVIDLRATRECGAVVTLDA